MITKEQYDKMKLENEEASRKNDYSKMIIIGSPEEQAMKEYERSQCTHPNITTLGGQDICTVCGKHFN